MKHKTFISLIALLLLASISFIGCDDDEGGGSSQDTQALTENDFANDPGLRADPERDLIVHFLETPDADIPENDTGEVGTDTIPYTYTRTVEHTFCWEDDDVEAGHFMELEDSEGSEVLRVDVNGECVTEVIEAGDYLMHIHHDGGIEDTRPVFIIPGRSGEVRAKKGETIPGGMLARAGRALFRILEKLDISISQPTNAQTVQDNIRTLFNTKSCVGCNLFGANLERANLPGANLNRANLEHARLDFANLSGANLSGARLASALLNEANLSGAQLVTVDLIAANLNRADLSGADLFGADLSEANLIEADLSRANLRFADLSEADLSFATWCDGSCVCANPSIGTCVGCQPVNICRGP